MVSEVGCVPTVCVACVCLTVISEKISHLDESDSPAIDFFMGPVCPGDCLYR